MKSSINHYHIHHILTTSRLGSTIISIKTSISIQLISINQCTINTSKTYLKGSLLEAGASSSNTRLRDQLNKKAIRGQISHRAINMRRKKREVDINEAIYYLFKFKYNIIKMYRLELEIDPLSTVSYSCSLVLATFF